MSYVNERVLISDVYANLVQLEESVHHQVEDDWTNLSLVTTRMDELFMGLSTSMNVGATTNMLSQHETDTLIDLQQILLTYQQLPIDSSEDYSDLTDSDQKRYEELGIILSDIDFKEISDDNISTESVMQKVEELVEELEMQ